MENATKALLIASGALIAVIILSLAVALFASMQGYIEDNQNQIEINANNKFNTQFFNYQNRTDITIQEIVTVANIAYENNVTGGLSNADESSLYVTVNIKNLQKNLEKNSSKREEMLNNLLINQSGKTFSCTKIEMNSTTGRVKTIEFKAN